MSCYWMLPRQCPWVVKKRVMVKVDGLETWGRDCCAGHAGNANREALDLIMSSGRGSWHTVDIAQEGRKTKELLIRPYLAITRSLHERMIMAQQKLTPRITMHAFITTAIENRVKEILGDE